MSYPGQGRPKDPNLPEDPTEGLRAANVFMVEGAGSTIRIPLDQSRAALDRLDNCLTKNSRALETNPFVAPPRQP